MHPLQLVRDLRLVRGLVQRRRLAAAAGMLAAMAAAYAWPHAFEMVEVPPFKRDSVDPRVGSFGTPWLFARALCDVARAVAENDRVLALQLLARIESACGPRKVERREPKLRLVR